MSVKDHYENLLAEHYSWMLGDFETKISETEEFFRQQNIFPLSTKIALDLGAGSGLQSIPLAKLGFHVRAIDFSEKLLSELEQRKNSLPIEIICDDILNLEKYSSPQPELIVCMGDTITHLPDKNSVQKLFSRAEKILSPKGKFLLSYRELSHELTGEKRFIHVRQSEEKIFTCFLEYFPEKVRVHDIIHERIDGVWQQKISSYDKLRISSDEMKNFLSDEGFEIIFHANKNGFHYFTGVKR